MKKVHLIIFLFTFLTLFSLYFKKTAEKQLVSFFQGRKFNELETSEYVQEILRQTGKYDFNLKTAFFEKKKISLPKNLANLALNKNVLGTQTSASKDEKLIEIDLTNQKLYAKEGNIVIYEFPISSGFPWTPTVTGEFRIWVKLKYTRMKGGCEIDDCYDFPNVPYTQYFYKGYGIHGTYWHNDFGRPRSHGCINLRISDAEKLFYWTMPLISENQSVAYPGKNNPGTKVIIYGKAKI